MKYFFALICLIVFSIILVSFNRRMALKVGDKVADFTLKNQNDASIKIGDFIGKQAMVIYFYPKDETPGCTAEACAFRDSYHDFEDVGAKVIGISGDDVASHKKFADKHRLHFDLLADIGNHVRNKIFGVKRDLLGLLPGRVTYIIDKNGIILEIFNSMSGTNHHTKALEILKNAK
jgi:thioredoxin-dependent peroxiredoxin